MTGIVAPTVVPHEDTILFFAELFASTTQGDLEVELYRSSSHLQAEVRREFKDGRPSELVLKERLDLTPMLQAWLKDLLDRAQKTTTD